MKKRVFAALLCLCMALCPLLTTALAATNITSTGLDLANNTPQARTTYTAGGGTVVWTPTVSGGAVTGGTLSLTNATINVSNPDPGNWRTVAFNLPSVPVTVVCNGTNNITATDNTSASAFRCNGAVTFQLAAGSSTNLTVSGQVGTVVSVLNSAPVNAVTVTGSGALNMFAISYDRYPFSIFAGSKTINLSGGKLALNNPAQGNVTLGGVTIPAGKTLNLRNATVTKGATGAVNNGELILPDSTTPAQIIALGLTGSGTVKVGNNYYTNAGVRIHTSPLLFTEPPASGNWDPNATLAADGYTFSGSAATGYTLTLGNLFVNVNASDPAIRLPLDGPVNVVLTNGTTARIANAGAGIAMQFPNAGTDYPCTITGGGKLVMSAEGLSCLETRQPLTIAGGDITMTSTGTFGIDAFGTALTISGGKLYIAAHRDGAAIKADSLTLSEPMIITSPAGAAFSGGYVKLNGQLVPIVTIEKEVPPPAPTPTPVVVPKTGDGTPLLGLALLALLACGGLALLRTRRRPARR